MSDRISIAAGGAAAARAALERCVAAGGVALFPADGLYGLCCDPLNSDAIERIERAKGRPEGKPSAVMYFSALIMRELIGDLGASTGRAVGALLPGPVTLVVANPARRYPLACGADPDRLGIRLIDGPLWGVAMPVFQTSANRSGRPAPAESGEVDSAILSSADLVIDGGRLTGSPSTVLDLAALDADGSWRVLRHGGMGVNQIARRLRAVGVREAPLD